MSKPIYTSSWATRLPPELARIGISRGVPRGQPKGFRIYRKLAPGDFYNRVAVDEYHRLYAAQLADLDPEAVVRDIHALAGGLSPALLCFERPEANDASWCHRGQVSAWLWAELGIVVYEYGMSEQGHGGCHPKLHSRFRAVRVQSV
jgi:hypothetical protein